MVLQAVAALAEQVWLCQNDPRRRGSGVERGLLRELAAAVPPAVCNAVRTALRDLMPPGRVEQYISERIEPLRLQETQFTAAVQALDPAAFAAERPTPS